MSRRAKRRRRGVRIYAGGLRKVWLAQAPNRDEARELRKHRLADGTYSLPIAADAQRPLPFRHVDPRLA